MANKKIRGITIQLGADASPIDKVIKNTEKISASLNSELKQVNKLLKFDPGNTELLAQKQKLLSESIENTGTKLKALKQAQSEVEKMFKNGEIGEKEYREFQRTVAETEQQLKSYTIQMDKMQDEQEKLKTGTKQLNTFLEATGKTLDDFQDILGTKLTNALKNGTANSDDLTVALNKIAKEALGAEVDLGKMRETLNKVDDGSGIDEVSEDLQNMKEKSDDANDALNNIGAGIKTGNLMQAAEIIADAGEKIKEFRDNAKEAFKEIDSGADIVITATGATGELAKSLNSVYERIVRSYPTDNLESIGQAVGEVNTQFGYVDDKLQKASELMLKFADITNSDVVTSTQNAKQAISAFELTNEDLEYVLDSVAKASQNTGVSVDTLFDNAISGAASLKELDLSFSQSIKLLGSFEQAGVDGSAALSYLTKASVNYAKEGKTLSQGLAETQEKILGAKDQTEALNVAAEIFGTKGAARMVDAIQRGTLNLAELSETAEENQGTVERTFDDTLDAVDKETVAANNAKLAMADFGNAISEAVAPILEALIPIIQKVADWFSGLSGTSKTIIVVIGALAAVFATLLPILAVIAGAITTAGGAMTFLTGTFLPVAGIIAGVIAIVSALIVVIKNWGNITDWISDKWNKIKGSLGDIWDGIYKKAKDVFSKLWKYIKDGFGSLKDSIGKTMSNVANAIIKPIGNAVNGVIKGVNWILEKVGSDKHFDLWEVPKFARGTGGIKKDTLGIVNDQKGSTYKEMIVPPDGDPFIPEGRDVVLPLKKGTKIMPANETKSFLESLPHFAKGIGEFFGGVWESVKSFTGQIWDYISNPDKIVQIAIDKFTDLADVVEPWISVAKGTVNTVVGGVVDFVRDIFDTQSNVNYNPSAGVEQWRNLAKRALQITNQYSEANLTRLLYQMQTESGGNPNAINNWDINAKRGIPSKGLMQVIDPTFRAYAMKGYDKNIYDPLSNMLAAIRYTVARYGSLARGWQGHGYEEGIGNVDLSELIPSVKSLDVQWFKDGGILTKPTVFDIGNGKKVGGGESGLEAFLPIEKLKDYVKESIIDIFGDKNINITMNITQALDGRTVAKQTVKYMKPMIEESDKLKKRIYEGVR
ncbi:MAG: phage tail tape measure protein [Dorea sp.]